MFALTKDYFDSWLHVKNPSLSITWASLTQITKHRNWNKVYISIYDDSTLNIETAPKWAIPVYTDNLLDTLNNDTYTKLKSFDSWIDVAEGPQRLEDIPVTHQIRLLTSTLNKDIRRVKRFVLASVFSPFMWRLTIQERHTFKPLAIEMFDLPNQNFPILGLKNFNDAEDIGAEYDVTENNVLVEKKY